MEGLIIPAFIAGILTILAPCTLPLVPAYLGFISGSSLDELRNGEKATALRAKVFLNGLLFVLGFSLIFVSFGLLVGFFGGILNTYRFWLSRIGGLLVLIFGLYMLGLFKLPLFNKVFRVQFTSSLQRGKPLGSFLLGISFASGWTPCIGPVLGSILVLASTSQTAFQGGFLLSVFSAGLAVPFLIFALAAGSAAAFIKRSSRHFFALEIISGLFLIFIGILLLTGNLALLISWGYRVFKFINYDRILNYL